MESMRDATVLWHQMTVLVIWRTELFVFNSLNICAGLSSGLRSGSAALRHCLGLRRDAFRLLKWRPSRILLCDGPKIFVRERVLQLRLWGLSRPYSSKVSL